MTFSDTYIQRAKKTYTDSRGRRNLSTLNTELHDVQRIMVQNIDDVLQRGAVLSGQLLCWILVLSLLRARSLGWVFVGKIFSRGGGGGAALPQR